MNQVPRLKEFYVKNVIPALEKEFGLKMLTKSEAYKNRVNIGLSEAKENVKVVETATAELAAITGQKPLVCRANSQFQTLR
jgi:large subunit ribosomal protein L5